jgi:hypothetical protein
MLAPEGPAALSIGRSRVALRLQDKLVLKLHDQPIFTAHLRTTPSGVGMERVVLDLCGMWTPATTKAMNEYAEAVGTSLKASLSKGRFTASYRGTVYEANFNNTITIGLNQ